MSHSRLTTVHHVVKMVMFFYLQYYLIEKYQYFSISTLGNGSIIWLTIISVDEVKGSIISSSNAASFLLSHRASSAVRVCVRAWW